MKCVLITLVIVSCFYRSVAQPESIAFKTKQLHDKDLLATELKSKFIKYDFSKLFNTSDNSIVYGFIGDNYQRIRIKFITITKDRASADTYNVYGKSMVKSNIDEFHGTIKITNIRKSAVTQHGCEDGDKFKGYKGQFSIIGDYSFSEDSTQNHSGVFKGTLRSNFFLDKNNQVRYDDIENCSDSFNNNQFVGQWIAYKNKLVQRCNWGDFRISNSGDLDIGAGEFSPGDKYLPFGWQSLRDLNGQSANQANAKKEEEAKWWE